MVQERPSAICQLMKSPRRLDQRKHVPCPSFMSEQAVAPSQPLLVMERSQPGPPAWDAFPELTHALLRLAERPATIPEASLHTIERFVILPYKRTCTATDVNKARRKMFAKKNSVQRISPTSATLEQHVRRAVFQGAHVWGQSVDPQPVLPSPTDWGWSQMDDGSYQPFWATLPEAAKTRQELISCGCKKICQRQCKCKKMNLSCTALCF